MMWIVYAQNRFWHRICAYESRGTAGATGPDRLAGKHRAVRGGGRTTGPDSYSRSGECVVSRLLSDFDQPGGRDRGDAPDAGVSGRSGVERKARRRCRGGALESGLHLLVRVVRGVGLVWVRSADARLYAGQRLGFLSRRLPAALAVFSADAAGGSRMSLFTDL